MGITTQKSPRVEHDWHRHVGVLEQLTIANRLADELERVKARDKLLEQDPADGTSKSLIIIISDSQRARKLWRDGRQ